MTPTDPDRVVPSLYAPEAYVAPDPAAIVRDHPFALLVTTNEAGIFATSTAMFFESEEGATDTLVGHMSRANGQAASFVAGQNALAVFSGPHAYISSSWYVARPTVPTWNYVSAHVRGTLEPIDDPEAQLKILRLTAARLEAGTEKPWTLEDAPPGRVEFLLPKIRSFRLRVERLEGVTKLNQTNSPKDRLLVIRRLLERGDGNSTEIARWMSYIQPLE